MIMKCKCLNKQVVVFKFMLYRLHEIYKHCFTLSPALCTSVGRGAKSYILIFVSEYTRWTMIIISGCYNFTMY